MIEHIAILGTGLIGGSLGLCWKERTDATIIGFDEAEVLDQALRRKAIDLPAANPQDAVEDADLVVLATPLSTMLGLLDQIAPHLGPDTIVTDVGSVKRPVIEHAAEVLPEGTTFIGGHPMAGAEEGGIEHAEALLFENTLYVLCPPEGQAFDEIAEAHSELLVLLRTTGARLLPLSAERHDRAAAVISHLPQLTAVALARYAGEQHEKDDILLDLAAGGFRDMTRIAGSPFPMWRDILVANRGSILDALGGFAAAIQVLRNRLVEEDVDELERCFDEARHAREEIPRSSKGFLNPLADVYVRAEDKPGELHQITKILYEAGLNVKDLELLRVREGTGGAFRVGFENQAEAERAVAALTTGGYDSHVL